MKCVFVDDDFRRINSSIVAVLACDLDRSLGGFEPLIAKEHIGHSGPFNQFVRQSFCQRILKQI